MGQAPGEIEQEIEYRRQDMGRTLEEIGDRVSPRRIYQRQTASVRRSVRQMRRRVFGDHEQGSSMQGQMEEMQGRAEEQMHEMGDRIRHAPEQMEGAVKGNPMAAGLIAFGAGLLLGSIIADTQAERDVIRSAQPQMESARQEMQEAAQHVADDVKQTATEEARGMRESASESAREVGEEARHAGQEVRRQS